MNGKRSRNRPAPCARRKLASLAGDVRGASAVEFAIILPLLILIAVAVGDIGLAVYRKMQVENAAQAGAEYAIVRGFDTTAVSNAVTGASNASGVAASPAPVSFCGCATATGPSSVTCGSNCPGGTLAGTYATVSAQGTYSTVMNYPGLPSTYTFNAQSTVRLK